MKREASKNGVEGKVEKCRKITFKAEFEKLNALEMHLRKQVQVGRDYVFLFRFCSFMRVNKLCFPCERCEVWSAAPRVSFKWVSRKQNSHL